MAIESGVAPSKYFAFNIAYAALFAAFSQLSSTSLSVARIKPVLDMAEPILKTEPEKTLKKDIVTRLNGSIELGGVYFRYNEQDPYILENFNLKIRAGEYVAIVGKTGCGKSTLVRLLLGFEKPNKGVVFYDGKDIERIDLKSLRRKIGSVIQDGKLFFGDIFHNIAIASEKLTQEEAWEAAEMAGIADDIRAMPMGMHTIIAEGQGGISGGQKQRLLIARAVASKPRILIFDEATSALDNKTQKKVSEALDRLKCTRIVIAHRLSTIKNCDRILVLDNGKIAEDGTYEELIAKNGLFARLVERQRPDNDT
jgi:ABC-type bacteriocin/lantibiotic exporter with double-glycine peptidase domain